MKTRTWLPVVVMATASVVSMGCAKQINVQVFRTPEKSKDKCTSEEPAPSWEVCKVLIKEWDTKGTTSGNATPNATMAPYGTDRWMQQVDVSPKYQLIHFARKKAANAPTGTVDPAPPYGSLLLLTCPAAVEKYPSFDALHIKVPEEAYLQQSDPKVWAYCGDEETPKPERPSEWNFDFDEPKEVCEFVCRGGPAPTHVVIAPALMPNPPNSQLEAALECK